LIRVGQSSGPRKDRKKLGTLRGEAHILGVMQPPRVFDPAQRAAEKQASRDADARALAAGAKSREQLCLENDMFAGAASIVLGKPNRAY